MNATELAQHYASLPRRIHEEVTMPYHGAYVYDSSALTLGYGDDFRINSLEKLYPLPKPEVVVKPKLRPYRVYHMAVKGYDRSNAELKCEFATLELAEAAGFSIDKIRRAVRGVALSHLNLIWQLATDPPVSAKDIQERYSKFNRGKVTGEKKLSQRVADLIPRVIELSKTLSPSQVGKVLDLHPRTVKRILGRAK